MSVVEPGTHLSMSYCTMHIYIFTVPLCIPYVCHIYSIMYLGVFLNRFRSRSWDLLLAGWAFLRLRAPPCDFCCPQLGRLDPEGAPVRSEVKVIVTTSGG